MFDYNRKLLTLFLAGNRILDCNAVAFYEESFFSHLDTLWNRIEELGGWTFSRLKILNILQEQFSKSLFKGFINLKERHILSLAVKTFSKLIMKCFVVSRTWNTWICLAAMQRTLVRLCCRICYRRCDWHVRDSCLSEMVLNFMKK
jgi:hypothetical protein